MTKNLSPFTLSPKRTYAPSISSNFDYPKKYLVADTYHSVIIICYREKLQLLDNKHYFGIFQFFFQQAFVPETSFWI